MELNQRILIQSSWHHVQYVQRSLCYLPTALSDHQMALGPYHDAGYNSTYTLTHQPTRTHTCMRAHKLTCKNQHTQTQTCTHAYTHTHACARVLDYKRHIHIIFLSLRPLFYWYSFWLEILHWTFIKVNMQYYTWIYLGYIISIRIGLAPF